MIVDVSLLPELVRQHLAEATSRMVPWRTSARLGITTIHGWSIEAWCGVPRLMPMGEPIIEVEAYPPLACLACGWVSLGRHDDPSVNVKPMLLGVMVDCAELRDQLA